MPRASVKTRKPIDRLTLADLAAFPIWEFAIDEEDLPGRDETWVRPSKGKVIARGNNSLSVASAFATASGRRLSGLVGVCTRGGVELGHAVLLARRQYLFISPAEIAERARVAAALQMSERELFPLRFKLRPRSGRNPRARRRDRVSLTYANAPFACEWMAERR